MADKVFQIDLPVFATAYIRATSAEEAHAKLMAHFQASTILALELREQVAGDFEISGARFDDDDLPEFSLSPAMSVYLPKDPAELPMESDGQEDDEDEAEA